VNTQLSNVDVPTPDGAADAYLVRPGERGRYPAVLLYMDAFGPRPRLAEMAERIAGEGYVVLVPNVFYRHGRAPLVDLEDLQRPENRSTMFDKLRPVMASLTPELAVRDAGGYLDYLAGLDCTDGGPVGITGYCMGGALALRTAAAHPDRVAAVASFHGGRLATDAPDSPHLLADRLTAELYFGHADHDHSMTPEQIRTLEQALDAAGVSYRSEVYPGAQHGFTMADTAAYDEAGTERHWTELLGLLDRRLAKA
jgi:carboxymethylenebutenolidase